MKSSCASTHEGTANSRMDTVTMQHSMVNPQASPSLVAHQTSKAPQSSMDLTNEQKCVDSNAGMDSTAGKECVLPFETMNFNPFFIFQSKVPICTPSDATIILYQLEYRYAVGTQIISMHV